jgi:hypothetical protein
MRSKWRPEVGLEGALPCVFARACPERSRRDGPPHPTVLVMPATSKPGPPATTIKPEARRRVYWTNVSTNTKVGIGNMFPTSHPSKSAMGGAAFFVVCIQKAKAVPALSLPRVVVGAGPQRPSGPVGADDDARGHSLRADEREFAWRGSIRKDTFASA